MPWTTRDRQAKARTNYTWDDAVIDLTLNTRRYRWEAERAIRPLRGSRIHPFDAIGQLSILFDETIPYGAESKGTALRKLLDLES